jgi:hypothetical protein
MWVALAAYFRNSDNYMDTKLKILAHDNAYKHFKDQNRSVVTKMCCHL